MYVNATSVGGGDTDSEARMASAIRTALRPFERVLQRVIAHVQPDGMSHLCRLRAWSERGHTIVVEGRALSCDEALATATDSLKRALEQAPSSRRWTEPAGGERQTVNTAATLDAPLPSDENRSDAERAPRVLLVLDALDHGAANLLWACLLVESLRGHLVVCRSLPGLKATASLSSGRAWLDATRRVLSATRETRVWCDQTLPHATLADRAIAGVCDDPGELASIARQHGADWIVLSAHATCGAAAAALARAAGRPVLVARASTTRHTLLVATDVESDSFPALDSAARLAVALQAPVLVFHDVQGLSSTDMFPPQVDALGEPWTKIQEALQDAVDRRPPELDVVLSCSRDRVQGILQQARREDAEMIIMSLPASESPRRDELAASVADGALRSVLIVPSRGLDEDRVPSPDDPGAEGWDTAITGIRRARRLHAQPLGRQRRRWRT
jgi:nucleotide-binding universal stress UspA family protein